MNPEVEIIHGYPPNFELIKTVLPLADETHVYCYGNYIYTPDGHEIPPDIIFHESIHSKQQGDEPAAWWMRYLSDPDFRREQEEEAYCEQYLFAVRVISDEAEKAREKDKHLAAGKQNLIERALFDIAQALSGEAYGSMLSYGEAETLLKRYAKRGMSERREDMLSEQG